MKIVANVRAGYYDYNTTLQSRAHHLCHFGPFVIVSDVGCKSKCQVCLLLVPVRYVNVKLFVLIASTCK